MRYFWNILIAIDQLVNTIFGGDPDETISSRTEKAKQRGQKWAIYLSKFLDLFEKDHTKKSLEADEGKDQLLDD